MRVLGIDPGYAIVGWGVVDYAGNRFAPVSYTHLDVYKRQRKADVHKERGPSGLRKQS